MDFDDVRLDSNRPGRGAFALMVFLLFNLAVHAADWTASTWQGETAYTLATSRWTAIVSTERGRLAHFGIIGHAANLLFAPADRDHPAGWGGHRVWLGPQTAWSVTWPPPAAWEKSAAAGVTIDGSRLELRLSDTGGGWPGLIRIYEPDSGRLACRVLVDDSGARNMQIIQILQIAPPAEVTVATAPTDEFPDGFALLPPIDDRVRAMAPAALPEHVARMGDGLRLQPAIRAEKLGFPPQELMAGIGNANLHVYRGPFRGTVVAIPDAGFLSQVYLGPARSPVIELEQLSPLGRAGEAMEFSILLDVSAR